MATTSTFPRNLVAPTGEKRAFHSLRHTFVRIALENNRPIVWLSSISVTRHPM